MPKVQPIAARLARYGKRDPVTGCLIWTRARVGKRYGRMKIDGRNELVHRVAWVEENGPIPAGKKVLHRCDCPPCFEGSHLFLGTQADNVADMVAKRRHRPPPNAWGSDRHSAKVTEAQIPAIRADGRAYRLIAADFGIAPSTVCNIKSRKTWVHVA